MNKISPKVKAIDYRTSNGERGIFFLIAYILFLPFSGGGENQNLLPQGEKKNFLFPLKQEVFK